MGTRGKEKVQADGAVAGGLMGVLWFSRSWERHLEFARTGLKEPRAAAGAIDVAQLGAGCLQALAERGDKVRMPWGEVGRFTGVGGEVEQLRLGDPFDQAAPPSRARRCGGAGNDEFPLVLPDAGQQAAGVVEILGAWAAGGFSDEKFTRIDTVDAERGGQRGPGERGKRGQQIHRGEDLVALPTGGNLARPARDERDTRATLPSGHFPSAQRLGVAGMIAGNECFSGRSHGVRCLDPRTVVGRIDHEGVFIEAKGAEGLEDLAGGPVDLLDRIAVGTASRFAFEGRRGTERDVRHVVSEVEKERFFPVSGDVGDGFAGVIGGDIVPRLDGLHDHLAVTENRAAKRTVGHRHDSAIIQRRAVEVIEALGVGHRGAIETARRGFVRVAEVPLANDPGGIAGGFEDLGHREFLRMRHRVQAFQISGFADADRIGAGHQRGARDPADRLRVKSLEH